MDANRKSLTGYPSIDKPWLRYYNEAAINAPLPSGSMYDYLWQCNKDHLQSTALLYFGQKITYEAMFRRIDQIALALAAHGVGQGDVVCMVTLNTPEAICAFYALNRLGVTTCMEYVTQTPNALVDTIKQVGAKLVFVLDMFFPLYEAVLRDCCAENVVVLSLSSSMQWPAKLAVSIKSPKIQEDSKVLLFSSFLHSPVPVQPVLNSDMAKIMLSTSGTTGIPKKVVHTSFNINSVVFQYQTSGMKFNCGEILLSMAPIFSVFGLVLAIHLPLCAGVSCVLCLDPDAKKTIAQFIKYRPHHFLCGDYHVLEMISNPTVKKMDLSFLRTVAIGGESLSPENVEKVNDFLKTHHSHVPMITGYGMTELAATATTELTSVYRPGTVGIPQNKVIVKIIDSESGKELTYGKVGEVLIHSPSIMEEYWENPQETQRSIETDEQGQRWLHTGDLGKIDEDGFLTLQGRLKRIYRRLIPKSGAIYKVFPDHIEAVINKHPAVKCCAVVCIEDREIITAPIAFVILEKTLEQPDQMLTDHLLQEAGEYNVPIRYIYKDALPLLPNGKVDYRTLEHLAGD